MIWRDEAHILVVMSAKQVLERTEWTDKIVSPAERRTRWDGAGRVSLRGTPRCCSHGRPAKGPRSANPKKDRLLEDITLVLTVPLGARESTYKKLHVAAETGAEPLMILALHLL
ncbi:hypothetical protein SBA3_4000011 [Candidatus Sulfopaludibacter sp. SbA3]|nr:hypothetical protein SBA3_4000011 [Candidatus Sulfopaludibacter sp. SbA3]